MLRDPRAYLVDTFLGARTAAHQAALGCRFRCTFCGVAAMFRGATALPPAERLDRELAFLKHEIGADSIQFYDHNFFDREEDMMPLLEVLARHELPWWCYARADALINLSPESWRLVRASRLRMAYIGAETPNDRLLKSIRKGTRADQTLEVAELCRRNGVIPELSFMVAPPEDPEGETERTFDFIRRVKKVNPQAEIIVYIYTPLPAESVPDSQRLKLAPLRDANGEPVVFPATAEQWTERRWVDYSCHADAPWLSDAPAPAHPRFQHGARLPLSDRHGHPRCRPSREARVARCCRRGGIDSSVTISRGSSSSDAAADRAPRSQERPVSEAVRAIQEHQYRPTCCAIPSGSMERAPRALAHARARRPVRILEQQRASCWASRARHSRDVPAASLAARDSRGTLRSQLAAMRDERRRRPGIEPPKPVLSSGAGLLCGASRRPAFSRRRSACRRSALVQVGDSLLRHRRWCATNCIEFAAVTLAARVQGLVPLHAGCVGARGRGSPAARRRAAPASRRWRCTRRSMVSISWPKTVSSCSPRHCVRTGLQRVRPLLATDALRLIGDRRVRRAVRARSAHPAAQWRPQT